MERVRMVKLSKQVSDLKTRLQSIEGAADVLGDVDSLISAAAQFDDLDPVAAKNAIGELPQLQSQLQELQGKAGQVDTLTGQINDLTQGSQQLHRELIAARTVSSAGILPEFRDLLEPTIAAAAVAGADGKYALPDDFLGGLKERYPSAFAAEEGAGTGGAGQSGQAPETTSSRTVKVGDDRVISGVDPDEVLNGSVKLA
jgi:hypothetical protein